MNILCNCNYEPLCELYRDYYWTFPSVSICGLLDVVFSCRRLLSELDIQTPSKSIRQDIDGFILYMLDSFTFP